MIIKEFNIYIHDSHKFAELSYSVDEKIHLKTFKNKKNAIVAIEKRIIAEHKDNSLKKETNYVLLENEEDSNIEGLLAIVRDAKESLFKKALFLFKNLDLKTALKFIYIEISDYFVLSDFNKNDLYLAELAIDKEKQGKGYGKLLLKTAIEIAKKEGFKRVVLDVELENTKAKKIYEHIGFKTFNKRTERIFNKDRGMYNMEYLL